MPTFIAVARERLESHHKKCANQKVARFVSMEAISEAVGMTADGVGIASGLVGVAKSAFKKVRFLGRYDPTWYHLTDSLALTASEMTAVTDFLTSTTASPLLRFATVAALTPQTSEFTSVLPAIRKSFLDVCMRWTLDRPDRPIEQETASALWDRLVEIYSLAFSAVSRQDDLAVEVAFYEDFLADPIAGKAGKGHRGGYAARLLEIAENVELLLRAGERGDQISDAIFSAGSPQLIEHIDTARNVPFESLYVERNLSHSDRGESVSTEHFASGMVPFRSVIVGQPGAGKSTLVKHLQSRLVSGTEQRGPIACLVVHCRDHVRDASDLSLQEALAKKIRVTYSLPDLTLEELEVLLTIGSFVAVFDGLDEITDISLRQGMVQKINSFATRYPATSILVTSRIVGYEHTRLDPQKFERLELQQFDDGQIEDYVSRWFYQAGEPRLAASFMSESGAVSDLRANPLLLSLLCNLYKNIGQIPANRRSIYYECARLLFQSWDAHRQIEHPHAMPQYQDRLMREIARWFHSSANAQSGVEEGMMRKVIAIYLRDNIGLIQDHAESDAADFLRFCAGRAWLLTMIGSKNGQRVFGFTHRTFLEFFAAESIARSAKEPDEVAAAILREDSVKGTVVPDLILQSFDNIRDRGATDTLIALCKSTGAKTASTKLLLRLLDGAIIAPHGLDACFEEILSRWTKKGVSSYFEEFSALLSIGYLARHNLLEKLRSTDESTLRRVFFELWSTSYLDWRIGANKTTWSASVEDIAGIFRDELQELRSAPIDQWATLRGIYVPSDLRLQDAFICESELTGRVEGFLSWFLSASFSAEDAERLSEPLTKITDRVIRGELLDAVTLESWVRRARMFRLGLMGMARPVTHARKLASDLLAFALLSAQEVELLSESELETFGADCLLDVQSLSLARGAFLAKMESTDIDIAHSEEQPASIADLLDKWSGGINYLSTNY